MTSEESTHLLSSDNDLESAVRASESLESNSRFHRYVVGGCLLALATVGTSIHYNALDYVERMRGAPAPMSLEAEDMGVLAFPFLATINTGMTDSANTNTVTVHFEACQGDVIIMDACSGQSAVGDGILKIYGTGDTILGVVDDYCGLMPYMYMPIYEEGCNIYK